MVNPVTGGLAVMKRAADQKKGKAEEVKKGEKPMKVAKKAMKTKTKMKAKK
jgi:hypothetical protein